MKFVLAILSMFLFFGCRSTVVSAKKIWCPNLDEIFPITQNNYKKYLLAEKYDTVYVDSTYSDLKEVAKSVVGETEIFLIQTPKYNRKVLLQKNLENNLSRRYDFEGDTIKYYIDSWSMDNVGFRIGNSFTAIDGFIEHDKGYEICWKEALAIGELNLRKYREQKGYEKTLIQRNDYYLEPLWIFTVKYKNGKQKFFTVDGVTGEFRKSNFFKIYPNAVKGVRQR
jgi:hypothetical protein